MYFQEGSTGERDDTKDSSYRGSADAKPQLSHLLRSPTAGLFLVLVSSLAIGWVAAAELASAIVRDTFNRGGESWIITNRNHYLKTIRGPSFALQVPF